MAVVWWRKAADGGQQSSQLCLGTCYQKGEGVQTDLAAARHWFKKSADQGNTDAQFELGKMIVMGKGGSKDFMLGMGLIAGSKDKGNEKASAWCSKLENDSSYW